MKHDTAKVDPDAQRKTRREALVAHLLELMRGENPNRNPVLATAQLDAAELLTDNAAGKLEQVREVLLDGIAGNRGYYPQHIVRAIGILLKWSLE